MIVLPLLGFIVSLILGRKCGKEGSIIISCGSVFISALLSLIAFYEVGLNNSPVSIKLVTWLDSENFNIVWGFLFDSLTVSMLIPILWISLMVHIYSIGYMENDPHNQRFFSYLSLFTFFMLILVAGDNYLITFVGWEGVGVCSFLLINFWYTRIQANKSAMQALIMNRIGDWGFSIALFTMLWVLGGNCDYGLIMSSGYYILASTSASSTMINIDYMTIICLFLFIAAMGKSAQLGLHTWLPSAMEAPTPVSALLHAATMVTAGVYLIMRSSSLFENEGSVLNVVIWIGALTAFFAATTGLVQNDLKRVIAYSTASQLGYMVMACGLSQYHIAFFHLINHAFFKALLFLGAGSVIHAIKDEQDIRKMGGLINLLPFTYTMILIGSLSLMALPFLTGFYSKDPILEVAISQWNFQSSLAYWLGTISAFLTAFYSWRLLSLTFLGSTPNGSKIAYESIHEPSWSMTLPLILLSLGALFFGYIAKDLFIGIGSSFWNNALYFNTTNSYSSIDSEFMVFVPKPEFIASTMTSDMTSTLNWSEGAKESLFFVHEPSTLLYRFTKFLPLILSISGALLSWLIYNKGSIILYNITLKISNTSLFIKIYTFLNQKYWFDNLYNYYGAYGVLNIGRTTSVVLDRGAIELIGPYGLVKMFKNISHNLSKNYDTGFIPHYAFYILIGLLSFLPLSILL